MCSTGNDAYIVVVWCVVYNIINKQIVEREGIGTKAIQVRS